MIIRFLALAKTWDICQTSNINEEIDQFCQIAKLPNGYFLRNFENMFQNSQVLAKTDTTVNNVSV